MDERDSELGKLSDHEIAVRMSLLLAVADQGMKDNDDRVYRPLEQIQILLDELKARYPKPQNQIVQLTTLKMVGEAHM